MQSDAIPSALSHVIQKMSNFKLTRSRLTPESTATVSAGGSLTIRFPSSGIVDFSSFMLHGLYTATGTTPTADHLETHISRMTLTCGGVVVTTCPTFNDVYKILYNATASTQHQRQKNVMNSGALGPITIAKQNLTATAAITTVATELAAQDEVPAVNQVNTGNVVQSDFFRNLILWNGSGGSGVAGTSNVVATWWAGMEDLGYVDMSLLSGVELELQMSSNAVMSGNADNTWALSSIYATVSTITYPTWSSALYNVLLGNPQTGQGGELLWKYRAYTPYTFAKIGGNGTSEQCKFSLSSSCLNRVWYSMKNAGYATLGASAGTVQNYFRYADNTTPLTAEIKDLQLSIDNQPYPNYRLENKYGFANALASLNKQGDTQFDSVCDSISDFKCNKYWQCFNFQFLASEHDSLMSGVNTQGLSSNLVLDLNYVGNVTTGGIHIVICEHQKILRVAGGRVISIES